MGLQEAPRAQELGRIMPGVESWPSAKGQRGEEGWSRGKMLESCLSLRCVIPEKTPTRPWGHRCSCHWFHPRAQTQLAPRTVGRFPALSSRNPRKQKKNPPSASSAGMAFISRPVERRDRASSFCRSLSTTCGQGHFSGSALAVPWKCPGSALAVLRQCPGNAWPGEGWHS